MTKKYFCPKCGKTLSQNKKDISNKDYFAACLNCDEDFFEFEVLKTEKRAKILRKIDDDLILLFLIILLF
jgi:transcription elongation factor Elf1